MKEKEKRRKLPIGNPYKKTKQKVRNILSNIQFLFNYSQNWSLIEIISCQIGVTFSHFTIPCVFVWHIPEHMNLRCILRWTIYLLGIIGAILSIFCFAADQNDNNQASQANPNASNKTFGNFFTLILSVAAVVPLFLHYNTPKLFYMLIYILPGLIAMICAIYYFWLTIKEMIATGGANDSMVQRLTKGEPKQASSNLDNASSHGGSKTRSSKRSSKA